MTDAVGVAELALRVEGDMLPVITLWQPWASLCFVADAALRKHNETRGFPPPAKYVGQRVAIHAAAAWPAKHNIKPPLRHLSLEAFGLGFEGFLPRGVILGTVRLLDPMPTERARLIASENELAAGNYDDERWAWPLADMIALPSPIPAKGKQGWWKFPVPALAAQEAPSPQRSPEA